eukprot:15192030-Ditylum_brightwellii.AAC.1
MAMLWHVQHVWQSGCRYTFNTYHHWKLLVVRGGKCLFSKKELKQGDPLAMIFDALGMLPIIDHLAIFCNNEEESQH